MMERYWTFASELFAPLQAGDGHTEAEILKFEKSFSNLVIADANDIDEDEAPLLAVESVTFPPALRAIYARSIKRDDLHRAHDRLQGPALEIDYRHVLLVQENQSVADWGIAVRDLALADPSVYVSLDQETSWTLDHDHLGDFLFFALLWERVNQEPCETRTITEEARSALTAASERVALRGYRRSGGEPQVFHRPGAIAIVWPDQKGSLSAHFGARTDEALNSILELVR